MGAVLKVLLRCLLRMLTPYIDFQGLVSTRTPSSFNFSSPKGEGFYFCPALNMSLEAYAPFCMLFLYKAPLRGIFFVKLPLTIFACRILLRSIVDEHSLFRRIHFTRNVCTYCVSYDTWPSASLTFQLSAASTGKSYLAFSFVRRSDDKNLVLLIN